jgi:hypothetical protein
MAVGGTPTGSPCLVPTGLGAGWRRPNKEREHRAFALTPDRPFSPVLDPPMAKTTAIGQRDPNQGATEKTMAHLPDLTTEENQRIWQIRPLQPRVFLPELTGNRAHQNL